MSIYDDLQPVVQDVLAEFRQGSIVLLHVTPGSGPVDDPGPSTVTRVPVNGTVRGAKFSFVSSGLALATDLQVTLPVASVVPTMLDSVELDGVAHKIVKIMPKPANGTPVANVLIVRK